MVRYGEEYRWSPPFRPRGGRALARSEPVPWRARGGYDYGYDYGYGEYGYRGYPRFRRYGAEYREWPAARRPPRKPARGYPVRGYHTYDLDYGGLAGPTTDYSGRAGYPTGEPVWEWAPRGPYTPTLEEIGRAARLRRERYAGAPTGYRRRRRWRR